MIQQYIGNNATYKYFMDLVDHLMIERSRTEEVIFIQQKRTI